VGDCSSSGQIDAHTATDHTNRDNTQRKQLPRLPNRTLFQDRLKQALAAATCRGQQGAVGGNVMPRRLLWRFFVWSEQIPIRLMLPAHSRPGEDSSMPIPAPAKRKRCATPERLLPLTLLATTILFSSSLVASEPATPWQFQELAGLAIDGYPEITGRRREQDAAAEDLSAARWQRYPTPGIDASLDDDEAGTLTLSLQQPIWTGGRITAGIDSGDALLDAATASVLQTEQEVLLRLAEAFVELQRRQEQVQIAGRNMDELEELKQTIARRVQADISPSSDLELAKSRLSQARVELASLVLARQISQTRLSELAGREVEQVSRIEPDDPYRPTSLDQAISAASDHAPGLALLSHQQRAAEADVRSLRASRHPTIALRLEQREQRGDAFAPRSDTRALLVVEADFGPGFSRGAEVGAAEQRRQAIAQEQQTAFRELRNDVSAAWFQLTQAEMRLDGARLNRESTGSVSDSYRRQYAIGQKSWLDLMNVVREAGSAALAVEDARAERGTALLRLSLLSGTAWQGMLKSTSHKGGVSTP